MFLWRKSWISFYPSFPKMRTVCTHASSLFRLNGKKKRTASSLSMNHGIWNNHCKWQAGIHIACTWEVTQRRKLFGGNTPSNLTSQEFFGNWGPLYIFAPTPPPSNVPYTPLMKFTKHPKESFFLRVHGPKKSSGIPCQNIQNCLTKSQSRSL